MSRNCLIAMCMILAVGSGRPAAAAPASTERPNIVYVMLDDAGWGDFGANGSPHIKTPTFDRMAREGMRFTHHYSGSAVCAPTRCVLMTGLHAGHARRRDNTATGALADFKKLNRRPLVFLEPEDLTVAEALKQAGYVTGGIGKWGLGNPGTEGAPDRQGFDHFYGYLDQVHAHEHYTDWLWRNGQEEKILGNAGGERWTHSHDLFEKDTLDFIEKNKNKRFFLYLPYCLPHGKYDIPDASAYADKPWSQTVKNYAAMISRADETVGRILGLLQKLNLDEKTIVFYTSDNGPNKPFLKDLKSGGPFRGIKRQLTEGGLRAAMVVRWPGQIPAGRLSDFAWSMIDFFPTACELASAEIPSHLDGRSVLPTLRGQEQAPHEFIYWEIHHPFHQAVRMGRWKGLRYGTQEPVELYDVLQDPGETRNLASREPQAAQAIARIMDTQHKPSKYYPAQAKSKKRKP